MKHQYKIGDKIVDLQFYEVHEITDISPKKDMVYVKNIQGVGAYGGHESWYVDQIVPMPELSEGEEFNIFKHKKLLGRT